MVARDHVIGVARFLLIVISWENTTWISLEAYGMVGPYGHVEDCISCFERSRSMI